jgi:hypothetical protein
MRVFWFWVVVFIIAGLIAWGMTKKADAATSAPTSYNCAVVKKPSKPDWVWYRYPSAKHPKRDAYNNRKVDLIWEDSYRAHRVEIRYRVLGTKKWKKIETADDASVTVKKLKNGVRYEFQVRGVSNCGKSGWQSDNRIRA